MGDEEEWMLSNLVENEKVTEDEEEEEEALSLCDLPNKEEKQSKKESPRACSESQEEFDFWWWGGSSLKESEMCAADDVFFQGQILPLRHSISSDGSFAGIFRNNGGRCHSFRYTGGSSRSSSVKSHLSSSSASSSTSTTTTINSKYYNNNKKLTRFDSPRFDSSQVRFSKVVSHANGNNNCSRKSSNTLWSLFRAGLVSTPEIDFHDLKIRQHNNNNRVSVKRNLKQRFSDKNTILFSTCSCSVNDVRTVPPRMESVRRNSSAKEGREDKKGGEATKVMRKQAMSRLRTFEWLKQLSLEGSAATL